MEIKMKKRFAALMIAAMAAVSVLPVTAFAGVTESAPDPYVVEMNANWYDDAGNAHNETLRPKKEEQKQDPAAGTTFTWQDGAGNAFDCVGTPEY